MRCKARQRNFRAFTRRCGRFLQYEAPNYRYLISRKRLHRPGLSRETSRRLFTDEETFPGRISRPERDVQPLLRRGKLQPAALVHLSPVPVIPPSDSLKSSARRQTRCTKRQKVEGNLAHSLAKGTQPVGLDSGGRGTKIERHQADATDMMPQGLRNIREHGIVQFTRLRSVHFSRLFSFFPPFFFNSTRKRPNGPASETKVEGWALLPYVWSEILSAADLGRVSDHGGVKHANYQPTRSCDKLVHCAKVGRELIIKTGDGCTGLGLRRFISGESCISFVMRMLSNQAEPLASR